MARMLFRCSAVIFEAVSSCDGGARRGVVIVNRVEEERETRSRIGDQDQSRFPRFTNTFGVVECVWVEGSWDGSCTTLVGWTLVKQLG